MFKRLDNGMIKLFALAAYVLRRDRVIVPLFVAQCIEQVTHRQGLERINKLLQRQFFPGLVSSQLMACIGSVVLTVMCKR